MEEIKVLEQVLQVVNRISHQLSPQKIHIVGEVIAPETGTVQTVITTDANLFRVGRVEAGRGSRQMVASTSDPTLRALLNVHYQQHTTNHPR